MSPRSRQRKPVTTGFPGHCVATRFSLSRQRGIISCTCERNKSAARSTAHTTRISERDLVFAGEADNGLSRQKISIATDDPQSLCRNKEISIVIGVDRPRVAIEKAVVTGHEVGVAIGFLVTTHGLGLRAHDRARWQAQHKSSVAIEKSLLRQTSQGFMSRQRFLCHNKDFPVATEISLSRQSFPSPVSRQSLMRLNRVCGLGRPRRAEPCTTAVTACSQCACDIPVTLHCVVHCWGHCTWTLFTNTVQ